jgi:hypothetical protein
MKKIDAKNDKIKEDMKFKNEINDLIKKYSKNLIYLL